jgi:hypothetical protein
MAQFLRLVTEIVGGRAMDWFLVVCVAVVFLAMVVGGALR